MQHRKQPSFDAHTLLQKEEEGLKLTWLGVVCLLYSNKLGPIIVMQ